MCNLQKTRAVISSINSSVCSIFKYKFSSIIQYIIYILLKKLLLSNGELMKVTCNVFSYSNFPLKNNAIKEKPTKMTVYYLITPLGFVSKNKSSVVE